MIVVKIILVPTKGNCLNFQNHPSKCLYYLSGSCRNRRKNRKFLKRANFLVLRILSQPRQSIHVRTRGRWPIDKKP